MKFLDLHAQYKTIKKEIDRVINHVITNGDFIMGSDVYALEDEVAAYCGTRYGIALNSGTDALYAVLKALGIQKGDEVIVPAFTYIATAEVVVSTGATPVFVDIDEQTYTIAPDKIRRAITRKTKAIIPVHLYGLPAAMTEITTLAKKHRLYVIEDAAQAIGARYGQKKVCSFGVAGCLSFFPTKNLGAYGDGGMVVTNNKKLADFIRKWRIHGQSKKYYTDFVGASSRLDTIQGAILRAKLKHLDAWTNQRIKIATRYNSAFKKIQDIKLTEFKNSKHVYHQYSIRINNRNALVNYLKKHGIPSMIYYPLPLHLQKAFNFLKYTPGDFPVSERISSEILSLPIYPELSFNQQKYIISTLNEFFEIKKK